MQKLGKVRVLRQCFTDQRSTYKLRLKAVFSLQKNKGDEKLQQLPEVLK
jgi:hypothetical protein